MRDSNEDNHGIIGRDFVLQQPSLNTHTSTAAVKPKLANTNVQMSCVQIYTGKGLELPPPASEANCGAVRPSVPL